MPNIVIFKVKNARSGGAPEKKKLMPPWLWLCSCLTLLLGGAPATMGDDAGQLEEGHGPAVTGAVLTAPASPTLLSPTYSVNESMDSAASMHTADTDDDEFGPHAERLLPNRPRRSSFDVALNEDPLFRSRHPFFRKLRHSLKKGWGLTLMIMSSAMLSTTTLVVSLLSTYFSAWEIGAARLLGQWLCTLVVIKIQKHSLRFEQRAMKAMVLRCFAGLGSMLCLYLAIRHMAMANATIIRYTSPAMVAFLAKLVRLVVIGGAILQHIPSLSSLVAQWFGEPFTRVHIACCILSFCGAVFVAQPSFIFGSTDVAKSTGNEKGAGGGTQLQQYIAWGFAVSAAVFAALAFLSLRALKVSGSVVCKDGVQRVCLHGKARTVFWCLTHASCAWLCEHSESAPDGDYALV